MGHFLTILVILGRRFIGFGLLAKRGGWHDGRLTGLAPRRGGRCLDRSACPAHRLARGGAGRGPRAQLPAAFHTASAGALRAAAARGGAVTVSGAPAVVGARVDHLPAHHVHVPIVVRHLGGRRCACLRLLGRLVASRPLKQGPGERRRVRREKVTFSHCQSRSGL
eukprot:281786-Prorocentrum_minimum.AAC.2